MVIDVKKILFIIFFILPINIYATEYITNKEDYTIHITDNPSININDDIIVIDDRVNSKNIKIVNSYRINNSKIQKEVINEILEYNKKYPSKNWIRSSSSMLLEWKLHNLLYKFNLFRSHTVSVDFEFKEEVLYNLITCYLQKIGHVL